MSKKNKRSFKNLFKRPKKEVKLRKMFTYVIIVNYGLSEPVMKLLQEEGSNAQCVCLGRGTANKEVLNMLGLEGNRKDVILAFVDEDNLNNIKKELSKFFKDNKRYMGIGFTLKLSTIVGEKVYHFLTNTI